MGPSTSGRAETLPGRMDRDLDDVPAWIRQNDGAMGERLIKMREWIDRLEGYFADGLRPFERSGEYGQDGALSVTAWLRWKCKFPGAPAGELELGGTIHAETVRRFACDSAITRITGRGELEHEISHASRTISASLRRKLEARDDRCVFEGCDMPGRSTDGHHPIHWADGGPTTLENLALLCRRHHTKVHEEGWRLRHRDDGGYTAIPPPRRVIARSRSG